MTRSGGGANLRRPKSENHGSNTRADNFHESATVAGTCDDRAGSGWTDGRGRLHTVGDKPSMAGLTFAVHESGAIHVVSAPGMALTAKQVTAIRGDDGQRVAIEAGGLVEEPDTLATYADTRRF